MKIVLREWMKDKKASLGMVLSFITRLIVIILAQRVLILIPRAFSDVGNIGYHLSLIGSICLIEMILESLSSALDKASVFHCFSTLNNQYGDKLLDADVEMFTKYSCASIYTTTEFLWSITSVGRQLKRFALDMLNIVVILYSMYQVGGIIVIPVALIYIVGAIVMERLYKSFDGIDKELAKHKKLRNQELENIINGFTEVRSFNMVRRHKERLHELNDKVYKAGWKRTRQYTFTNLAIDAVDNGGVLAVTYFVMLRLGKGLISQASAMSLVMLVFRLINPLLSMLDFIDELSQDLSLSKDYEKIMTYVNKYDHDGDIHLDSFDNSIELDHVSFTYNNSSEVLTDVSMSIKKGQKIGICGTSGAGKSTLFKLLNKFYAPSSGSIKIDGIDIWDLTNSSYRDFIFAVHQENVIFPGSIRDNITYGVQRKFSEAEFVKACRKANLLDFIMDLPDRFDTEVGPRGLKLSGGQKQRIALARLFLRDPEVILLDEATSALDNENESLIQDALNELGDKTVITIAHRLTTIKNCDKIYVMGNHKVIESGTHDELMAQNGEYARMINVTNKPRDQY